MTLTDFILNWHKTFSYKENLKPIELADFGNFIGAVFVAFDPKAVAQRCQYWCIDKKTGRLFWFEPEFDFKLFEQRKVISHGTAE